MSDDFDNVDFPDFDTDGVDETKAESMLFVDKTGWYHFELEPKADFRGVDDEGEPRFPGVRCMCTVLETVAGQSPAGAVLKHDVHLGAKGGGAPEAWQRDQTTAFLYGVGILKKVDGRFIDPETGGTKINVGTLETRLKGLQFIGHPVAEKSDDPKYDGRVRFNFGKGAYTLDHPAVVDVPKNLAALKAIGRADLATGQKPAGGSGTSGNGGANGGEKPARGTRGKKAAEKQTEGAGAAGQGNGQGQHTQPAQQPAGAAMESPTAGSLDDFSDL
jgi:hypothetical protein